MSGERCKVCGSAANIFHEPWGHAYESDTTDKAPEPAPHAGREEPESFGKWIARKLGFRS